ncbi:hypothetical protein GOP47_0003296 [Adiantum capillus-veneris]|uniref:Uncharacterized protein n=1 Tax=Adiantum capillus-veneris TaxID=13818 RepID=A0A9D4VDH4_ADICA|nr:hypothetical protein GOP47_0003296 [Adiantum capillus-veneris]
MHILQEAVLSLRPPVLSIILGVLLKVLMYHGSFSQLRLIIPHQDTCIAHLVIVIHNAYLRGPWRFLAEGILPSYPSYELTGKTDLDVKHEVKIQFKGTEDCPSFISLSATSHVTDINNQVQSAAMTFIIHPSFIFAGFKLKETFGRKGGSEGRDNFL